MFLINASFATFDIGEAVVVGTGVSNDTSPFADIHFILISLISLFKEFIVSIKYLMMYPDNKININTNKSIFVASLRFSLFKERYKNNIKIYRYAATRLPRPDEITRSINHRENVDDPRIYDDIQFNIVLVDIRYRLTPRQVE